MKFIKSFGLAFAAFIVILAFFSVYIIQETERGILIRLKNFQTDPETGKVKVIMPGLHFKMPFFVDDVKRFDVRIQNLLIPNSRIPTSQKKELMVDFFTKWRIVDFDVFYQTTDGNINYAENLLKKRIEGVVRREFGRRTINDVVWAKRSELMEILRDDSNTTAKTLGLEVVDVRMIRIDLPKQVSDAVFGMMRTERNRVAAEHRAKGHSRAEAIKADADAQVTVLLAQAEQKGKVLRGEGDAESARIYNEAYQQDPEFFSFYKSLQAYQTAFHDHDLFLLKPDSPFFKHFSVARKEKQKAFTQED